MIVPPTFDVAPDIAAWSFTVSPTFALSVVPPGALVPVVVSCSVVDTPGVFLFTTRISLQGLVEPTLFESPE